MSDTLSVVYSKLCHACVSSLTATVPRVCTVTVYVFLHWQPLYQECGSPSISLWHELRREVLLPAGGVPAFDASWQRRQLAAQGQDEGDQAPEDWVVVLARPPETRPERAIAQSSELEARLRRIFPSSRVVVFDGGLPILQGWSASLLVCGLLSTMSCTVCRESGLYEARFRRTLLCSATAL